jgi:hypothetical protein
MEGAEGRAARAVVEHEHADANSVAPHRPHEVPDVDVAAGAPRGVACTDQQDVRDS